MNINHFTQIVLKAKQLSGKSDLIISSLASLSGSAKMDIENGRNYAVKDLLVYLKAVDAKLYYKDEEGSGEIVTQKNHVVLQDLNDGVRVQTFRSTLILDLLAEVNQNQAQLFIKRIGAYKEVKARWEDKDTWVYVEEINHKIRNKIGNSNERRAAIAKNLHISANSLDRFLYDVIDYDFHIIDTMLKSAGALLIFRQAKEHHCYLVYEQGWLVKYDSIKIGNQFERGEREVVCELNSYHISDFLRVAMKHNFTPIIVNSANTPQEVKLIEEAPEIIIPEQAYENESGYTLRRKKGKIDDIVNVNKGHTNLVREALKGRGTRVGRGICSYCKMGFRYGWEYRTENGRYINLCIPCKYEYAKGKINFKHMVIDARM